ncbi:stage II sporulation protein E [Jeotgalibacillus soli]|uniref:PPM-type phosphatase domain-containing protein n=1 Tax=Jeotgalibacillus soli TaxID=889306 RepID=A0A0C2W939_9BACL|nr:stage II sporulation protein E [Jeotgalibacillus soli]KIL52528.1 hypothetical protein KP78_00630 [Jeotgalibacillus soli]
MAKIQEANLDVTNSISMFHSKKRIPLWKSRLKVMFAQWMFQRGVLHLIVSVLLGRALFLSQFTPFALPMFAVIFMVSRDKSLLVAVGLAAGASTLGVSQGLYTLGSILLFCSIQFIFKKWLSSKRLFLALTVILSVVISRFVYLAIQSSVPLNWVDGVMVAFEALLAGVLTLVFLQGIQLVMTKARKRTYEPEELVAIAIVVASVATGFISFTVGGLAVDHVITRYVVIAAALVAGAMIGSTVGIVTGLVFCLASVIHLPEVAILAVAGLLGGLLKSGKATGVSLGLMMATLLMGLFYGQGAALEYSLYESAVAALALFLTPKSWLAAIGRHIPGSDAHENDQQLYARKVRDVTAEKVQKFSDMFDTLSKSFECKEQEPGLKDMSISIDETLGRVTERTCQMCFKKDYCWSAHFDRTYDWMTQLTLPDKEPLIQWKSLCVKAEQVQEAFEQESAKREVHLHMKKQMLESNQFVSTQLQGLSAVMKDFAYDLQRENEKHEKQEEEMLQALREFGIHVDQIDVHSLEYGQIDVDVMLPFQEIHGECEKLIAPMLSSILKETIIVYQKVDIPSPYEGMVVTFRSSKAFKVNIGISHAAHGGGLISGDSHAAVHLHGGKYAVAISDGMGNGEKAQKESEETLQLLRQMLEAGIEEELAIKSVNSILTVKRTGDMYSTVDLAMIDLQTGKARFLKVGSVPSYIKRGKQVKTIEASNLPMGFFRDLDMDILEDQLKAGDLLIMLSDGVLEGTRFIENPERWIKRQISELKTSDPQQVADILMEAAVRTSGGEIEDDMTILTVQFQHQLPKWAAIPSAVKTG